ncbi:kelch-like protein 10 [Argiope bruennichi]|uniref:kelch-like protein 10 n=1 Tax=Argiope bruennichi TaxID=94029 RepID=UPI0024948895|nr:kelch-like protein 10 [Argiope bruennichi]
MRATASLLFEDSCHAEGVLQALNNLRILGLGCDAVLSTEDGGMFRVHRSIMSWCSTYFRTVFTTSLVDTNCGDGPQVRTFIVIPNVSATMLEIIIQYAYTGATPVSEDNVQELLPAADQFSVLGLVNACVDFLVNNLDPKNCIGIWRFSKEYFLLDLEKEAFRYILDHFLDIAERSKEYLELSVSNLNIILKDDLLNAEKEISVWNSVKHWVYYDIANRMTCLPSLLASIRLAAMSIDNFQGLIKDSIISKSIQCRPYLAKVAKFILQDLNEAEKHDEICETNALFQPRLPRNLIFCIGGLNHWGLPYFFEAYDNRVDSWKQVVS